MVIQFDLGCALVGFAHKPKRAGYLLSTFQGTSFRILNSLMSLKLDLSVKVCRFLTTNICETYHPGNAQHKIRMRVSVCAYLLYLQQFTQ